MSNNHDLLNNAIIIDETMHIFHLKKEYISVDYSLFIELKKSLDSFVNNRDEYTAYLFERDNEDISIELTDIQDETDLTQFEDSVILSLKIRKSVVNRKLSIYSINSFDQFLQKRTAMDLISIWNEVIIEEKVNHFELLDKPDSTLFRSKTFSISGKNVSNGLQKDNIRRDRLNHFHDISQMIGYKDVELIPDDFHNFYEKSDYLGIFNALEVCKRFFSLAFIANVTNAVDSEKFQIEIRSKERHKKTIEYEELLTDRYERAYGIYEWIYSETLVDKAQIVRYFMIEDSNSNISLDRSVLSASIKAYSQFLNKELDKFIDVQDRALLAIQNNQQKFRELRNNVVSVFKTNSFTMLGFFISNFLVKHVNSSDEFVETLVKKSGVFICIIFGIYLVLTIVQTFFETRRLKKDFEETREVLEINLIKKYVLKYLPDLVIEKEIKYIFKYSIAVFLLWGLEIVVMLIYIFS